MDVAILDSAQRWILGALLVGFGLAAVLLRWKSARERLAVACASIAAVAGAVLLVERLVALVVSLSAPADADFNEFRWVLLAPWGRVGLVIGMAVVVAIVVLSLYGSRRIASPWRRAAMVGLRTAAAATALVLFLEPAIELRQVAREPNRIAVLVDDSRSMALAEDKGGPTRSERARALIEASAPVLEAWKTDHHVDVFEFAESLVPSSIEAAARGEARGNGTLVRLALEQIRARYDGRDLAGVVLVSDGVATGGFSDDAETGTSRDFLQSLDTRVHTAWVGREGLEDVAVARVLADEFAFVRTVVRIEAVIRSTGFDRRQVPVTLSSDGKPLREKWVEIGPGATESTVVFEISPPRVGKYVYEISTPVAEGEAVASNNTRSFVVRVIRDKIRVLQVAGQPSWDVRALRRMFKQNPNVDLISFFILRTQDDLNFVPNDEMSLIPFPTQELFEQELPSFDVIVLQNFEFGPYGIAPYLDNIRRYAEGGGGLVMLGGAQSFTSGGYFGTPVAAALPVELPDPLGTRELLDTRMFRPTLTEAGKAHPLTALRYQAADNLATWKELPELEGVNLIGEAKADATVLAVHPRLETAGGKPMPVIVTGEYGKGRTLAVTTDTLWRWGFVAAARPGDDGRHYAKLWENSIRWLIQDPDLRYLHVEADAVEYDPGAPVRLDVRLLDRDYSPLAGGEVALTVARGSDPAKTEQIAAETLRVGDSGEAAHELSGLEPGVYRALARATVGGREVEAADIFLVREATDELDRPAASETLLRNIAGVTGGTFMSQPERLSADLAFAEPRIVRIDRRADVELWSRPGLLFLALLLLGLEWLLRQRSGSL